MAAEGRIATAHIRAGMRIIVERRGEHLTSTRRTARGVEIATVESVTPYNAADGWRQRTRYIVRTDIGDMRNLAGVETFGLAPDIP